jgi:antirestriction protein ArdC
MHKTMTRTPEQTAAANAFRALAIQLAGDLKEEKPEAQAVLTKARALPGLERFSRLNQVLILKQNPNATDVHTYKEWQALGFQVRKGEHATIRIKAPHQKEDGETGFHSLPVFDRSQVDPIATPEAAQDDQTAQPPAAAIA